MQSMAAMVSGLKYVYVSVSVSVVVVVVVVVVVFVVVCEVCVREFV